MKKITFLIVLFAVALLCVNVFGATKSPFEVTVSGKGKQSIIFIPGLASSGAVWDETITKFNSSYKCYKLTMPGFAGATAQENPSLTQWVDDVASFIKNEKIDKPIVIGHSLGAVMTMMLASKYPDLVSKIVIVDGLPCLSAVFNPNFVSNPNPDCTSTINQFNNMSNEAFKKAQAQGMRRLVADTSKINEVLTWSLQSDRKTIAKLYCDMSNTDIRKEVSAIQCPALVLLESTFKQFEGAMNTQFAQLKNAQVKYADKGLHFIMFDDKEWYFNQLSAFVK